MYVLSYLKFSFKYFFLCALLREKLEARELESCLFEEGEVNEGGRRSTTTKMRDTEE